MPRKSRIDAVGALHHVIMRGIDRSRIFRDDSDREDFLRRLSSLMKDTKTTCYAWALIPNHIHLLLKTGTVPIATVMRRLLTGYAVSFNRRHKRHGHLFQNRYKSILCQEDSYFLELVRYIHLNPIRAGIVPDMDGLDRFPFSGHSAILGKCKNDWQDIEGLLRFFADTSSLARRRYRSFVEKGIEEGSCDLTGGGLIRSSGGWTNVTKQSFQKSDERILGDNDFVEQALRSAREQMERSYRLKVEGFDLDKLAYHVAAFLKVDPEEIFALGKDRTRVRVRSIFCYFAVRELGITQVDLSRRLNLSPAAVTFAVRRGERLAREIGMPFVVDTKM